MTEAACASNMLSLTPCEEEEEEEKVQEQEQEELYNLKQPQIMIVLAKSQKSSQK